MGHSGGAHCRGRSSTARRRTRKCAVVGVGVSVQCEGRAKGGAYGERKVREKVVVVRGRQDVAEHDLKTGHCVVASVGCYKHRSNTLTGCEDVLVCDLDAFGITGGSRSIHDARDILLLGVHPRDLLRLAELEERVERVDLDAAVGRLNLVERARLDVLVLAVVDDNLEARRRGDDRGDGREEDSVREDAVPGRLVDRVAQLACEVSTARAHMHSKGRDVRRPRRASRTRSQR